MKIYTMTLWHVSFVTLLICCYGYAEERNMPKKTYIVNMDKSSMPLSYDDHLQWYESSMKAVSNSANMIYTYNNVIHGFSTRLTTTEAESLEGKPGILLVQEEVIYQLHTTRTPEFLGLDESTFINLEAGAVSKIIIGVLDTGVWPESKSFNDTGLGPIPSKWRGVCEVSKSFSLSSCNRKLIGARSFSKGFEAEYGPIDETVESKSPRDDIGHGTHTSTTAAGSAVTGASFYNYAMGTARGMAAHARVATYKVCWLGGCVSSDILAGLEMAVSDGVDILSISIGGSGGQTSDYFQDTVAVGAFSAMSHGIFVSSSAGNGGPIPESLSNVAPWITTVGAGTLDRDFPASTLLGNGKSFSGVSLSLHSGKALSDSLIPLVYASKTGNKTSGSACTAGSLDPKKVAGKIVVCDRGKNPRLEQGVVVRDAGGVGMILANTKRYGEKLIVDAHLIPVISVGKTAGDSIKKYISLDPKPVATITFGATQLGIKPSPVVAIFSSRGPNPITPEILKPDFIAPGVNILAGWTGKVGPSGLKEDTRHVDFNIESGTSMSCPHASGLAALIKSAHPEWSPAAIKSALMTTAYNTYKNGKTIQDMATGMPSTPFDVGAGHVSPLEALDPGLVYDANVQDYVDFLCALKYSSKHIKAVTKQAFKCDKKKKYNLGDLNYPSFAVPFKTTSQKGSKKNLPTTMKYTRTLTNVGVPATYKVSVSSVTRSVKIAVEPEEVAFSKCNEKKNYTVTFTATSMPSGTTSFARIEWLGGKYIVGSPVAFSWK